MKRLVLDIETTLDHQKIFIVVTKDIDTGEDNNVYHFAAWTEVNKEE